MDQSNARLGTGGISETFVQHREYIVNNVVVTTYDIRWLPDLWVGDHFVSYASNHYVEYLKLMHLISQL